MEIPASLQDPTADRRVYKVGGGQPQLTWVLLAAPPGLPAQPDPGTCHTRCHLRTTATWPSRTAVAPALNLHTHIYLIVATRAPLCLPSTFKRLQVVVRTSDLPGAGTDANVYLEMRGTRANLPRHFLRNKAVNLFERGQVRTGLQVGTSSSGTHALVHTVCWFGPEYG